MILFSTESLKASSSRTVLPVVTPYSLEGRQFSKSVRDHWHIIEDDTQQQSIWSNPPITAHHKTVSIEDTLVHSCQAKPTSLRSAPNKHHHWHLRDQYATLSQPTHTSQLAHSLIGDIGDSTSCMGASTNLKPTYMSSPSCTSWSSTPCPTHFSFTLQKLGIPNYMVFAKNRGCTKPCVHILVPRELNITNHTATLNQSTAISFHKRTPWYLIRLKHATF